jgi:hypothetical protein
LVISLVMLPSAEHLWECWPVQLVIGVLHILSHEEARRNAVAFLLRTRRFEELTIFNS